MALFQPQTTTEVAELVSWAAAERQPLEITAGASKRRFGRATRTEHRLDVARLAGIVDYDPSELVLTVRPATPLAEIEATLGASRQHLGFEPPDWRGLFGSDGNPTLGGVIACNLAGPRRVRAGAARDHFLGFSAVNGWGDAWHAGGRVVKNVTGYDICKLQAGAFGTLSVLTEVTVKVVPMPSTSCSLAIDGLDAARAVALMADALNAPHEVSAAAWLPPEMAARAGIAEGAGSATLLRLEGPAPSIAYRERALGTLLGPLRLIRQADSEAAWRAIGAVGPLLAPEGRVVWRLCPPPSQSPGLMRRITGQLAEDASCAFLDWAGGLVWLSIDEALAGDDCAAGVVRGAMAACGGGHATLIRAPEAARARLAVFEPLQGPALDGLTRRVKAGFDPGGVLNPGRLHEGI